MTQTTTVGVRPLRVGRTGLLVALGLAVLLVAALVFANQAGSATPGVGPAPIGRITPSLAHIRESAGATPVGQATPALTYVREAGAVPTSESGEQAPNNIGPENGIGGR